MNTKSSAKRMIHYDLLRVVAAFSVVMLHSSAQFWYTLDVSSAEWKIANFYDALFRFGVPIFVMISGALWLGDERELNLKKLYKHNILRLAVVYIVWSCLYGLLDLRDLGLDHIEWKTAAVTMLHRISGRYYLWFLPMIMGIYVLLPVLRSWVKSATKQNLQYFLCLFLFLQIMGETIIALFPSEELQLILSLTKIDMVCGYLGYFVLGYYIAFVGIPGKYHRLIYGGAIPAVFLNVALSTFQSVRMGEPVEQIYDSYGLFTFLIVTALFLFFTEVMSAVKYGDGAAGFLRELSSDMLGVYVMHEGLMELTVGYGLHSMTIPNIVGIPLYALFCFIASCCLAAILRRIPFVGRYLC